MGLFLPSGLSGFFHPSPFLLQGELRTDPRPLTECDFGLPIFSVEPDDEGFFGNRVDPGAGGDDGARVFGNQPGEDLSFAAAKKFGLAGQKRRKVGAELFAEKRVEIEEVQAQEGRALSTKGRFTAAAMADQDDRSQG